MKKIYPVIASAVFSKSRKKPRIIIRYSNGKRKTFEQKSLLNSNPDHRQIVREKVDKINMRIALGVYDDAYGWESARPGVALYQALDRWLIERAALMDQKKLAPKTVKNCRETVVLLKLLFPDASLSDLDKSFAKKFVDKYRDLPRKNELGVASYAQVSRGAEIGKGHHRRSEEDVATRCRYLSSAFSWMIREGLTNINPFKPLPQLRLKNPRDHIHIYLPSEIERFEHYFQTRPPSPGAAFGFSLQTGARAGGIIALNEREIFTEIIDGEPATLAILHEKRNKKRPIYLTAEALHYIDIMRNWYDRVPEYIEKFMNGGNRQADEYQSRVASGRVFFPFKTVDSLSQMFYRARRALGISGKFHDLRKTHTTELYDRGMDKDVVQNRMGWSEKEVMDNHYLRITLTRIVRDGRKIEAQKQ